MPMAIAPQEVLGKRKCLIPHSEESGNYISHYSSVKFTPLKMCPGSKPIKLLQIPRSSNYIYRLGPIPYTVELSDVHKKYCEKSKPISILNRLKSRNEIINYYNLFTSNLFNLF